MNKQEMEALRKAAKEDAKKKRELEKMAQEATEETSAGIGEDAKCIGGCKGTREKCSDHGNHTHKPEDQKGKSQ